MLLAGAAFPASAFGQCVTGSPSVDACMGGVRLTAPPGVTFDQSFLGGSLGPGAVFTRASTGTYYDSAGVLQSAAIDAPRFDYDPVTLQLKGLLLEDTSTNIVLNSAALVTQSVTTTATAYTLSFQGTGTVTKSGTATGALAGTGATQRVSQAFTPTAGTLTLTVTGSVTSAQVEALPYASSYIPTTTVAVTRAVDSLRYPVASIPGFDTTQGSVVFDSIYLGQRSGGFGSLISLVGAATNTDMINQYVQVSANSFGVTIKTGGTQTYASGSLANAVIANTIQRTGIAYQATISAISAINAVLNPPDGVPGTLPAITNLSVMGPVNSQFQSSGWARRARYWPRQLSQAELISVTR